MDGGTLGLIGGILGGLIGLAGGAVGTFLSIKNSKGPKEKSLMAKFAVVGWVCLIVFLGLLWFLPTPYKHLTWIPYGILLPLAIIVGNKKLQKIRASEGNA